MRMKWLAGLVVVLLCIAHPCPATVYYHMHMPLQNMWGSAMEGVTFYVWTAGTTDTAAVYADRAGTRYYQGSGRLTTDASGMFDCYVLAGCYDIPIEDSTRWGDIADTLQDYCYGIADSVGSGPVTATTLTVTGETVLGDAATDTVTVTGRMEAAALTATSFTNTGKSTFGDALTDTMRLNGHIQWGTQGNAVPCFFSDFEDRVMWFYETNGTRRLSTERDRALGIGGSFMFEEDGGVSFALADIDHDGAFSSYGDYATFRRAPRDTSQDYVYQGVEFINSRGDSNLWRWQGVHAARDSGRGVAPFAFQFETDIPDSNSVAGARTMMELRWTADDSCTTSNHIRSAYSSWLTMLEHDTPHYQFTRNSFSIRSEHAVEKALTIYDDGSGYTKLTNVADYSTQFQPNNGELDLVYMGTSGDSARIDASRAIFNYLTLVKWTGALPGVARAAQFGDGTAFWRGADAEPATAQTLFIYSTGDSLYHYWESDGMVSP